MGAKGAGGTGAVKRINPMPDQKVKAVIARLEKMLEEEPPKAGPSFKHQIQEMAAKIRALVKKGYKYDAIAKAINEAGEVSMKASTLRNYVPRAKRKPAGQAEPASKPTKPKAEKAAAKTEEAAGGGPERPVETGAQGAPKTPFPKAPTGGPRGFDITPDNALQ